MEVIHSPDEARRFTLSLRASGKTVGVVPTMGALHQGHLSLVQHSVICDATIATIFVNPSQFGPGEDLEKYPRTWTQDCESLAAAGVDAVYAPTGEQMYPAGYSTYIEPPEVAKTLEGVCRPGHFRGVATVVLKLFQAVPATHAFFGKKDFQQCRVIEAMVRDLDIGLKVVSCETIREPDGLALSSRNRYLSDSERKQALTISAALRAVADSVADGERSVDTLQQTMRQTLLGTSNTDSGDSRSAGVDKIEYAVLVDSSNLAAIEVLDRPSVALIAAMVGKTRLIDNQEISVPPEFPEPRSSK